MIDRGLLWERLVNVGVNGKMLGAVKSLYTGVSSCVRVNGLLTDWFDVHCGLRQGCSLSPLSFNLFINDLAVCIKALGKGVNINNELVSILMYADDIVLIAENEGDLQGMLDLLHHWCNINNMTVNCSKSNIVHFRQPSVCKTVFQFILW